MGKLRKLALVSILALAPLVQASVPNTFTSGTAASSSQVNANFTNLDGRVSTLEANPVVGLIYLGTVHYSNSQNTPNLGTTADSSFVNVPGGTIVPTLNTVYGAGAGTGTNENAFQVTLPAAGEYAASYQGTWAASLHSNSIASMFTFSCSGPAMADYSSIARYTLGDADTTYDTQLETAFTVTTWFRASSALAVTCTLQKQVVGTTGSSSSTIGYHRLGQDGVMKLERLR